MIKDINGLLSEVTDLIRFQMDAAVIGLSGGADSTLVTLLCAGALGPDNVYGIHMPYSILDKKTFNIRSALLAEKLNINHFSVDIGSAVDTLTIQCNSNQNSGSISELNQGNMRSRMRMVALYTTCCQLAEGNKGKRVRVVGTGNLSEDFIGYDTKGGDALADYFPIGTLTKSEVYQLLEYFRDQGEITEDFINRIPSAGLWDGQTDADELGYTYNEMESYVVDGHNGEFNMNNLIGKFVCERHHDNLHKHEAPPVAELRRFCEKEYK